MSTSMPSNQSLISRRSVLALAPTAVFLPSLPCRGQPPVEEERKHDDVLETVEWTVWEDYDSAIGRIVSLPDWPADRDFTPDEWQKYLAMAVSWQQSRQCSLEALLIATMLISDLYIASPTLANHWYARYVEEHGRLSLWRQTAPKLMILLRLMFDIPDDAIGARLPESDYLISGNGTYPAHAQPGYTRRQVATMITSPVGWQDGAPRLIARSAIEEHGGVATDYQPHIEYRYFLTRFRLRPKLALALDDGVHIPWPIK